MPRKIAKNNTNICAKPVFNKKNVWLFCCDSENINSRCLKFVPNIYFKIIYLYRHDYNTKPAI